MPKIRRVKSFCRTVDNNRGSHTCDVANNWLRNHPQAELIDWRVALANGKGYKFLLSILVEIDIEFDTDDFLVWSK